MNHFCGRHYRRESSLLKPANLVMPNAVNAWSGRCCMLWTSQRRSLLASGEVGSEQSTPDTFSIVAARRWPSQTDVTLAERCRCSRQPAHALPLHAHREPARLLSVADRCQASAESHAGLCGRLASCCDAAVARETRVTAARHPSVHTIIAAVLSTARSCRRSTRTSRHSSVGAGYQAA